MTRAHVPSRRLRLLTLAPLLLVALAGCAKRAPDGTASPSMAYPAGAMAMDVSSGESYAKISENEYKRVADDALSTFSIDVDTASYSNIRRFLEDGSLPPVDAVRIEEMINYFGYAYAPPSGTQPFAVQSEVAACPWNEKARLVQIGIKGREIAPAAVPPRNLVFLLDVSGSMMAEDKLPLLQRSLKLLVADMRPHDSVALVVYAGAAGMVLPPTPGTERDTIGQAIDNLQAGGSTDGGAGIELAYALAQQSFRKGGINRVILATDGDFNVGTTSQGDLERLIEKKRESGVFLSVLGFGTGNVKDSTMEMLADKGNGNYAYIDGLMEARKVLVEQAGGTLVTIAKDVKIQVEFNPARVGAYRLIGYENRMLAHQDFNNDKKDAGEIGAGHTVTALYEILPPGAEGAVAGVDPLKYQQPATTAAAAGDELMQVKLRFKQPAGDTSELMSFPIGDTTKTIDAASVDLRFASAVALFGMKLRDSEHGRGVGFATVRQLAAGALGDDPNGHRRGMLALIDRAAGLKGESLPVPAVVRAK
jgi:Ca-activated chloride channel family protein